MGGFKLLIMFEILSGLIMLFGIVGQKFSLVPFRVAFGGFALALLVSLGVFLASLVLTLMSFSDVGSQNKMLGLGLTLIAALPVVLVLVIVGKGFKAPRIHDISTDLQKNIEFVRAFELRRETENSLLFPEDKVKDLQKEHYPDLKSMLVEMSPASAFTRALEIAEQLKWKITLKDSARGQFEAIDETAIFGFKDDIVVRVAPFNSGSKIDLRSVSRVGVSDLGANAARIVKFQETFKGNL